MGRGRPQGTSVGRRVGSVLVGWFGGGGSVLVGWWLGGGWDGGWGGGGGVGGRWLDGGWAVVGGWLALEVIWMQF